ncbi:cadherin repeat domain-containing protein [Planctomicrobium piriforme]|uniref:cadherin repeat domain-containing protein n=1 Tax=Planctomicrobium piriforme TaxID=1576369 RepID=UPI001587D205|nr:cadherin repeat domain-containing protein [Planctomicrobium piriforme]
MEIRQLLSGTPVPVGGEFRANTYTTGTQRHPSIASDADGNFVVTWGSTGQDGDGDGIFAQRYNSSGIAQGGEFRVNTYTTGNQFFSYVAMDRVGNFVVTWQSAGPDGSGFGVFAQRYDSGGVAQGSEFRVNTYTTGTQAAPAVAVDEAGNFVVVWQSSGQDGNGYGVYAQRYNSSGVAQGSEFRINTQTVKDQLYPSIAMDSDGDFVVAWEDGSFSGNGQDGSGRGVYAQRFDSSGAAQGGEFRVNSYTTSDQTFPAVGMDSAGNFIVSWGSSGQDGSSGGVYAQRYDSAGLKVGVEFRVNAFTTGTQGASSVAMNGSGDFVISWVSADQDGDNFGIYAQVFDATGAAQGDEFRVNTYTTDMQYNSQVAMDAEGNFVVTWYSAGQDGSSYGVYAQRYVLDNRPTDLSLTLTSTAENQPIGTTVGEFAATDADIGDTFTFSLASGTGDDDNTRFSIDGSGNLLTAESFDYETKSSYSIRVQVADARGLTYEKQFLISVTNVNEPPVISGFDDAVAYAEGAVPQILDADATLQDVDSLTFNGGKVVVTLTANAQATDVLSIQNQGAAEGQIGLSGSNVTFGGVIIGTFTGGTNKVGLTINFNASCTPAAAQALLRSITFSSTSKNPVTLPRTVRVFVGDGGGASTFVSKTVNVSSVNDAPVVGNFAGSTDFLGSGAVQIDSDATVSDIDSPDFNGGKLIVTLTAGGQGSDVLSIRNQGTAAGQIGVSGSNVTYGGVIIGTFTGGTSKVGLTINFNDSATPIAAQALLRNITFSNSSPARSTDPRTVRVLLSDGDGGTSTARSKTVTVAPGNTPPVIGGFEGATTYHGGDAGILLDEDATVSDTDSANLDAGKLVVTLTTNGQGTDVLSIRNQGVDAGQIGVSGSNVTYGGVVFGTLTGGTKKVGLSITFNASSTPEAVQALLRNIQFSSTVGMPLELTRTVRVTLSDGDGGTSPAVTKSIHVTTSPA